ncbi:hypothetical protein KUCAC02_033643 [Chaenocephalus aceratus]|nr:hypothetical protein KUCAC02_033643 [Chaenocephalus aceratus]
MNLTDCVDAFMKRESSSSSQVPTAAEPPPTASVSNLNQHLHLSYTTAIQTSTCNLCQPPEDTSSTSRFPQKAGVKPPPSASIRKPARMLSYCYGFVGLPDPEILHSCPSPSLQPPALSTHADSLKAKDCRDAPPETSVPYFSNNAP